MGYKDEINEPVSGRVSTQVYPQVSRKGLADAELDRAAGEPSNHHYHYPARALRALGLLLADGAPTVGGGKTF